MAKSKFLFLPIACFLGLAGCNSNVRVEKSAHSQELSTLPSKPGANQDTIVSRKRVRLGCEKPGVRIDIADVYRAGFAGEQRRFCIKQQGRSELLNDLNQLKGLIQVDNADTALKIVRMRTSPASWRMWGGNKREVELVADSDVLTIPNFGLADYKKLRGSGLFGVFPKKSLEAQGYAPAKVRKVGDGFIIALWIFSADWKDGQWKNARVYYVSEHLREDGEYKRTILKQRGPSGIPNADLVLPVTQ